MRTSVSLLDVETCATRREPINSFSHTKWKSRSRRFILEWKIGITHWWVSPMISQSGRGGYKGGRCNNYWRRLVSHMISTAAETTKWYSASIEERVKKHKHICMEVSEIIVIACPLSIRVSYQCQGLWTTKKQNMVKCMLRYRIIRCFAAVQRVWFGDYMYWVDLFTACPTSSRERQRYCMLPIKLH